MASSLDHRRPSDAPEPILPEQFFTAERSAIPERRLLLAITADAWINLRSPDAALRRNARDWFLSHDQSEWPMTFNNICDVFGWSASNIWKAILRGRVSCVDGRLR